MALLDTVMAYVAADRRRALAEGRDLPSRSHGAALWADMAGFTPLSELLAANLGARQGAEQLAQVLNLIYAALIAPLDEYDGSVVGFSGDAITCWFDGDDGRRALAAAQGVQAAMRPFAQMALPTGQSFSLGIKAAVCCGPVRRFRVGDPTVQYVDTLAGATLDWLAAAGHVAQAGEVLIDEETAHRLGEMVQIRTWRMPHETGRRAGVLESLAALPDAVLGATQAATLSDEQVRPWLLPAVYARLQSGRGEFLTELRPAVALFLRFEGLQYDDDERVGEKLDAIIRQVQRILVEFDGSLLQLTIGDKGSYLYAAFGAPVAHEDDAVRAVAAAQELSRLPLERVSIGLSQGVMRTGAYGGATRRTYGVLGDDVNLAARLMESAEAGQVLASAGVWQATATEFAWKRQASLKVKGKRAAVQPAVLIGRQQGQGHHLPALAMIGRQAELGILAEKLELARQGHGQVVGIVGEAGMGKSRLLAELTDRLGTVAQYSGECQSYGTHSLYLVWQSIWRAFFGVDSAASVPDQIETLRTALSAMDETFLERLPLLGPALNLSIPDNGLTNGLDARSSKTAREALLVACLRARAGRGPLVLVLEDVHWIDPLSRDLLEGIARAIGELPVLVLLAYRPLADQAESFLPALRMLEYATEVQLAELNRAEMEQLIAARLAHFGLDGSLPGDLVERLQGRTQGNPFYLEELLNYLHDRGLDPREMHAWEQANLPDSLQSLILSRIDQLSEGQQITLKAASIIGRLFRVAWLQGYYPPLGGVDRVSAELEILDRLELVVRDAPDPQLAYLFKHVITQEVAYESLAYATRAGLHERFAQYLESIGAEDLRPYLDLLAYHYERSDNVAKKREYLRRAAEAAQSAYSNEAAVSYLERALALAPETDLLERYELFLIRERILEILGQWPARHELLIALSSLADALNDVQKRAHVATRLAAYKMETGDYPAAISAVQRAVELAQMAGADKDSAIAYTLWGQILGCQSNYGEARKRTRKGLALARKLKLELLTGTLLNDLAGLDFFQGRYEGAETLLKSALRIYRKMGNRREEAVNLTNLSELAIARGNFVQAQAYLEDCMKTYRLVGSLRGEAMAMSGMGEVLAERRMDYANAVAYCERALRQFQSFGDRQNELITLCRQSMIELARNNYLQARTYAEQALPISREIGDKQDEAACLRELGLIAGELGQPDLATEYYAQGLSIAREIGQPAEVSRLLLAMGINAYRAGQSRIAADYGQQALAIAQEIQNNLARGRALAFLGHVLRELGDLDAAAASYRAALDLAHEMQLPHFARLAQTGLACLALDRGDLRAALAPVDAILLELETAPLSTIDEIMWVHLGCYRILRANADPRADPLLQAAYTRLQAIAAGIQDETLRDSFLQNVRFNRELVQAWEGLVRS